HPACPGPARRAALGHVDKRQAEAARRRASESVRRHVRAARDPDPAREDGRLRQTPRADGEGSNPHGRPMRAYRTLTFSAIVALAAAAGVAAQQRFKAGVELVSLSVTVPEGTKYVT